jgi:putative membrane protein insertion efficiency factor
VNLAQHILVFGLRAYQRVVSPVFTGIFGPLGRCRFEPSCSQYALEAVRVHGAIKGCALAFWRLCRCQPWGGCGLDPVPPKISSLQFKVEGSAGAHVCEGTHGAGGQG